MLRQRKKKAVVDVSAASERPRPFVLPPGTPKDRVKLLQDAMRKVFNDPEFRAEFQKLVSDDVSPLTPEELAKVIREMPRDPEVIELLKKFSGVDSLPSR